MARAVLIKAKGGLGNRILSAVGGLVYAEISGRVAAIDWRDGAYGPEGENMYPLLFDAPPQARDPSTFANAVSVAPAIWRGRLDRHPSALISELDPRRHSDPFIYRKYCVDVTDPTVDADVAVYWSYLPKLKRMGRLLRHHATFRQLSTEDVFARYLALWFTPNARVRAGAADLVPEHAAEPVIGVHIRYTDRKTPLAAFEREIERALEDAPRARIFLATDSALVDDRFRKRFPSAYAADKWFPPDGARMHDNKAAPDMRREAENALIDMWALSRCDRLIFSRNSTFSYTSMLLGDLRHGRAVDVERRNPVIRLKRLFQEYA